MAYSTEADVERMFPLLVAVPDLSIDEFIKDADGEIDAILATGGYATPVTTTDYLLRKWSATLAAYTAWESLDATSQTLGSSIDTIFSWLNDMRLGVASGSIKLTIATLSVSPSVYNDSLTDPDYSQFELPSGFELNTDE